MLNGRIENIFTLMSPLSHIGESLGINSYLATQIILDNFGNPTEVFVYSGNAIRGMWRDSGAKYMLDKLGDNLKLQIPLDLFYLLFSGGSIGGDQSIDIDQARKIREKVPHLSLFGGGVGNMLLPGKINVGEGLPVCRELSHIIPDDCPGSRDLSWRQMTTENSYSRKDDAKDELLRPYINESGNAPQLEAQQMTLLGDNQDKKSKEKKDKPQQMRYTIETICRGTVLWQEIIFQDLTEIELGALVAAIAEWSKTPFLGGQARIGMGKVKLESWIELYGKERERFLNIDNGKCLLNQPAQEAKQKYDEFLSQYNGYIEERRDNLIKAIGGKVSATA